MEEEEQVFVFHLRKGHERETVGPRLGEQGHLSTVCFVNLFESHQLSPQRFAPHFCKMASQEDTPLSIKSLSVHWSCTWQVFDISVAALSWSDMVHTRGGWLGRWRVNPKDGAQQGHDDSSAHDVNKGGQVSRQNCNQSSQCWLKLHIRCTKGPRQDEMALLNCGLCRAISGEWMIEGGVGCLTSLIKQHKRFESQAVTTLVVYRERKIWFKHKNKYKGIQYGPVQTIYMYKSESLDL